MVAATGLWSASAAAPTIPDDRRVSWAPGVRHGIPSVPVGRDAVANCGASAYGSQDAAPANTRLQDYGTVTGDIIGLLGHEGSVATTVTSGLAGRLAFACTVVPWSSSSVSSVAPAVSTARSSRWGPATST
jgi:hypothetical protein